MSSSEDSSEDWEIVSKDETFLINDSGYFIAAISLVYGYAKHYIKIDNLIKLILRYYQSPLFVSDKRLSQLLYGFNHFSNEVFEKFHFQVMRSKLYILSLNIMDSMSYSFSNINQLDKHKSKLFLYLIATQSDRIDLTNINHQFLKLKADYNHFKEIHVDIDKLRKANNDNQSLDELDVIKIEEINAVVIYEYDKIEDIKVFRNASANWFGFIGGKRYKHRDQNELNYWQHLKSNILKKIDNLNGTNIDKIYCIDFEHHYYIGKYEEVWDRYNYVIVALKTESNDEYQCLVWSGLYLLLWQEIDEDSE